MPGNQTLNLLLYSQTLHINDEVMCDTHLVPNVYMYLLNLGNIYFIRYHFKLSIK